MVLLGRDCELLSGSNMEEGLVLSGRDGRQKFNGEATVGLN